MEPHLWFTLGWFWGWSTHSPHLANFHNMNKSESIQSGFLLDETKPGHMLQSCFRCNGARLEVIWSSLRCSSCRYQSLDTSCSCLKLFCWPALLGKADMVCLSICIAVWTLPMGQAAYNSCALAAASKPFWDLFTSMGFAENKMSLQQPSPEQSKLGSKKGVDLRLRIFDLAPCDPALRF